MNFENINLEKGMYQNPTKSFSQILEELDPTENYSGTNLEGLDAFSRQLKRFDIKVSGMGSDNVNKFFSTTQSSALFPEYVSRAVRQGMEEADVLSDIIAATTKINSLDYRTITSVPTEDDKELKRVAEGAVIPQTVVKTKENLVKLNKRGRMLVASYEALKYQRIDLFTVTLKQIGAYIARQQLNDALSVLENGDGNDNAAEVISAANSGELSYADLLELYIKLHPYNMNKIIVSPKMMTNILQLDEFKNPLTGINFQGTGNPGNPLGAKIIKTGSISDDRIIGLDSSCSILILTSCNIFKLP